MNSHVAIELGSFNEFGCRMVTSLLPSQKRKEDSVISYPALEFLPFNQFDYVLLSTLWHFYDSISCWDCNTLHLSSKEETSVTNDHSCFQLGPHNNSSTDLRNNTVCFNLQVTLNTIWTVFILNHLDYTGLHLWDNMYCTVSVEDIGSMNPIRGVTWTVLFFPLQNSVDEKKIKIKKIKIKRKEEKEKEKKTIQQH